MRIPERHIRDYFRYLFLCYFYVLILRFLEIFWVSRSHQVAGLTGNEIIGLITDLFLVNGLSVFILAVQYISGNSLRKFCNGLIISVVVLLSFLHVLILKYYAYALKPVDEFLFRNSFREVFFSITTSDESYVAILVIIPVLLSAALFLPGLMNRLKIRVRKPALIFLIILFSFPLGIISTRAIENDVHVIRRNVRINKSLFFYRKTFSYLCGFEKEVELSSKHIQEFQSVYSGKEYISEDYPLLHKQDINDVLGNFINEADLMPNFVILIVEGLGERFLHSFHGVELMPFLDSLSEKSLYWDRFFTNGERSFAVVPSITGSLPSGENGFMDTEHLPRHFTMISLLKKYGYQSNFFYGQGAWFHQKDRFFRTNKIDLIFDKSDFSEEYEKVMVSNNNFFWGYQDSDLFRQSLACMDTLPPGPRIDIYFTGSMHSPFPVTNAEYYNQQLDLLSETSDLSGTDQKFINKYRRYLVSVMFFDHALRQFMEDYSKRDEYGRSIFIITGDHPMTEIPIASSIERYHVPLIMYSPLLKAPVRFHSTGSHLDVYPSILAFLRDNYNIAIPNTSTSLGYCLDTSAAFRNLHPIAFMNDNREVIDYIENGYYLSQGERLYEVDEDFNLSGLNDPGKLAKMLINLEAFDRVNIFACEKDILIPDSVYFRELGYQLVTDANKDTIDISENTEYAGICPTVNIPTPEELYFEFSCFLDFKSGSPLPVGVIQIINDADSTIHWQSFNLVDSGTNPGDRVKQHIIIDTKNFRYSNLQIKSYLWNNEKGRVRVRNLHADFYKL